METFDGITYNLEYRSKNDNAWYTCGVIIEEHGKQLRVKFKDFIQSYNDEVITIADLSSHNQIEELLDRFRPVSEPAEDNECSTVIEGMLVCAIYRGHEEDMLYFDAIVDAVCHKEHTPEKCLCNYLLFWQHGPGKGNITATTLEDICLIKHNAILPKIAEFINIVKQKLKTSSNGNSNKSQDFGIESYAGRKRSFPELTDHDMDMGGAKIIDRHHYILLENLDKDLCPLLMMDFIHEHTSVIAQTYVFPSMLAETYARGAIVVDSRTKLKRICEFINNPNHFITSFSGRPWVVAEDNLKSGTFNTNLQNLEPKYKNNSRKNELKVVRFGTEEYRKSKQLKDLHLEFRNHLKGLLQRLAVEEKKNQDQSVSTNCKNAVSNGRCCKGARGGGISM